MTTSKKSAAAGALAVALCVAGLSTAQAEVTDYEFQLLQTDVKQGNAAIVDVRLVDKRTGSSVADAVIFATRIDMAPDGMETMTAPIEVLPSTEPGVYRFKANLVMAGGWRLSLGAKIQGETGTLESKLVLKATP
ncbi:FixH family protein [Ancylobacter polymorphus]|uniref:FixH family protein n=1 Tax=Ancylobacter polymorphus TaxID=223390 RepID=A0A9E7A0K5_9HYPH|nr:FixH family protein [Ancylobacter polymorphus]UOK73737.1 FixH family protein [Ancylobacter polymorphus]